MQRYFFDIKDGEDIPDRLGSEWADLREARIEAVRYAAEVLKEMPERFWNCEAWKMTVCNARREPIFTLKFSAETLETENADPELSHLRRLEQVSIYVADYSHIPRVKEAELANLKKIRTLIALKEAEIGA